MPPTGRMIHRVCWYSLRGGECASHIRHRNYERRTQDGSSELGEPAGAVALHFLVDTVQIQYAQQEISSRHGLSVEVDVTPAFQLSIDAAD